VVERRCKLGHSMEVVRRSRAASKVLMTDEEKAAKVVGRSRGASKVL